jgi:hypothetical protein
MNPLSSGTSKRRIAPVPALFQNGILNPAELGMLPVPLIQCRNRPSGENSVAGQWAGEPGWGERELLSRDGTALSHRLLGE